MQNMIETLANDQEMISRDRFMEGKNYMRLFDFNSSS